MVVLWTRSERRVREGVIVTEEPASFSGRQTALRSDSGEAEIGARALVTESFDDPEVPTPPRAAVAHASTEGVVTGRVMTPDGSEISRPWAMPVSWNLARSREEEGDRARRTLPRKDGSFALGGIPAGVDFVLRAENPYGPEWSERLRLEPGEEREVWIHLERARTVSGRVIDEQGRPVEGVFLSVDGESATDADGEPYARSGQHGDFVIQSPPEVVRITTAGHLAREANALVDVRSGSVVDVVLSVVRGESIAGSVSWPDSSPVDRFEVWGVGPGGRRHGEGSGGWFELRGLPVGSYELTFQAQGEARAGSARVDSIASGTQDLRVVLAETFAFEVRGTVVDPEKAPIEKFRLNAYRSPRGSETEPRSESAEGSQGTFVMQGIDPGEWTFFVRAENHQEVRRTVLIDDVTDLVFVLPPAGRVRGTVLDPAGDPMPGAWVGEHEGAFTTRSFGFGRSVTDEEGRFDLTATSPTMHLVALSHDHAASSTVTVDCPPGEDIKAITLQLREPCRIEGRVLDEHEDPVVYARVFAGPGPDGLWQDTTDEQGQFVLDNLPPGDFRLTARIQGRNGAIPSANVSLVPGQTSVTDLRLEREDPVRMRARLMLDDRPVARSVLLRSRSFATGGSSDDAGNLEVLLQQPGQWTGFVWVRLDPEDPYDMDANDVRRFDVEAPDADEYSLMLELRDLPRVRSRDDLER